MKDKLIAKSFLWMAIGLLVTFVTGYIVSSDFNISYAIYSKHLYIIFIILEFILVLVLSSLIHKFSCTTAKIVFLLYSFVSGLTFSSIFITYELDYILYVFFIAAFLFALFGFMGYFTKIDLKKIGTVLIMGLIGTIILEILNVLVFKGTLNVIICIAFLIFFLGITAWDLQKLKNMDDTGNAAIYGALQLYLDFINILINLLRLLSKRD